MIELSDDEKATLIGISGRLQEGLEASIERLGMPQFDGPKMAYVDLPFSMERLTYADISVSGMPNPDQEYIKALLRLKATANDLDDTPPAIVWRKRSKIMFMSTGDIVAIRGRVVVTSLAKAKYAVAVMRAHDEFVSPPNPGGYGAAGTATFTTANPSPPSSGM